MTSEEIINDFNKSGWGTLDNLKSQWINAQPLSRVSFLNGFAQG